MANDIKTQWQILEMVIKPSKRHTQFREVPNY